MVATLSAAAGSVAAQAPPPARAHDSRMIRVSPENVRLNNYLHDVAGPGAVLGMVGGGLVDHMMRKPSPWSYDAEGLGRRIGSRFTQTAVQASVRHGLASVMGYSTGYQPCGCSGFGAKVEHALLESFTDRRADGSRALSVPRIAGSYAGGLSKLAWDPHRGVGDVAVSTTLSFGVTAVFNIARELTGLAK
jgi:hypothetical protein